MKRFRFIGALFGFGAAAQTDITERTQKSSTITPIANWIAGASNKPANNQCPTCGTMAKAYYEIDPGGSICSDANGISPCKAQNLARCKHCNAAFWQDAESR
jgi:hypothetical protein